MSWVFILIHFFLFNCMQFIIRHTSFEFAQSALNINSNCDRAEIINAVWFVLGKY